MKNTLKTKIFSLTAGLMMTSALMAPTPAMAGPDPFIGELMLVGYNFCPRSWADADGQLLSISQNTALFSLYGTTYGGDGRTTFALPDLRGRAPIHNGNGPGLQNYRLGQRGGTESLTVLSSNMPSHNHNVQATDAQGDKKGPGLDFLAKDNNGVTIYHNGPPNKLMDPAMITNTGGGQAISKRSPFLAMRWCVALQGVFPSRN